MTLIKYYLKLIWSWFAIENEDDWHDIHLYGQMNHGQGRVGQEANICNKLRNI